VLKGRGQAEKVNHNQKMHNKRKKKKKRKRNERKITAPPDHTSGITICSSSLKSAIGSMQYF